MVQVGAAIAVVVLLMLALFLRSLVAPFYLLLASVLSAAAPMGLVTYLYEHYLGYPYLGYYAPLGAGVLLIALGSDYNLFMVGRVWQEARTRPLGDAIAVAVPAATGAIRTAAITLAASFALLAIVPLASFREFACAMVLGILIDAFIVRSYLVMALMALFGRVGMWPLRPATAPVATPTAADESPRPPQALTG
jgi:RND superfamily putative drug exporter